MSGIAVIHDVDREPIYKTELRPFLDAIEHRGATEFTWSAEGIAMGQRLLATTPEALDEHLPLEVAAARYQVVLDGRLDNRPALLKLLAGDHAGERPLSDQDLVALAYETWGTNCPAHLIGDFAFVLWDRLEQSLFAARDQRGFRPMVYARTGRRLVIGSEPAQLIEAAGLSTDVDEDYLARYLIGTPARAGSTPYAAVSELPAGHWIKATGDMVQIEPYWQFGRRAQLAYKRQEEYVEHFAAIFSEAVAAATRTIQPPGLLLSGGIDSSCVATEAVKTAPGLQAFVSYFEGSPGMDERPYASGVAGALGISLREFDASDCWSLSSSYLSPSDFDGPDHPMQSALMMKMAWEAAAGGVNVLIDGVGGDEFFTGTYGMASLAARGRLAEAGRRALRHRLPVRTALTEEVLRPLVPERLRLLSRRMRGKPEESKLPAWIDAARLPAGVNEAHDAMSSHPSAWSAQALRQEIWELLQCVSLPHLAWRSRRAYLPFGIEHRSPLWDLRVIEFYLRTPVWVHEDAGRTKAILRSVMQDKVPASVFQRDDKALFDTRLRYGLVDAEAQRVDEALLRSSLADLPFVKQAELEEELRLYQSRDHPWWLPLWRAITSGLWLQFGVPSGASTQAGYSQEIGALH